VTVSSFIPNKKKGKNKNKNEQADASWKLFLFSEKTRNVIIN
jgi:hypothetical protein